MTGRTGSGRSAEGLLTGNRASSMWPRDELDEVDVARRGVHRRHCPLHFAPVVSAVVDDVNDDLPEKLGTRPRPWPGIPHPSGKARFRRRAHIAHQALIF